MPNSRSASTGRLARAVVPRLLVLPVLLLWLSTSARAERWEGRLPSDVVPVSQTVEITLDPDRSDYEGRVAIQLRVREPTDTFVLNAEGLELGSARLTGESGAIDGRIETAADDAIRWRSTQVLPRGSYRLELEFHAMFDTTAVSLYRLDYEGEAYAFTQFQAVDAREAFPCFDEPIFKIPFRWIVTAPVADVAITNTPVEREEVRDGWRTTTFVETRPLSTYLLALAVGPFDLMEVPGLPVPARIVAPRGKAALAGTARDELLPVLEAAERYFDRPYPFRKLDLLAVPEFWPGAMEHPGAITYRDGILLLDPDAVTPGQLRTLVRVTAHEIAHQWFGNLVTMEWWDDLWLNEAFADWLGDRLVDEVHPEMHYPERALEGTQRFLRADARPSSRPIRRPVAHPDGVLEAVGTTYAKGKLVLGMFENWVGKEPFRRGVLDYLQAHEWGNAAADDLWRALDGSTGRPVSRSLAGFLEQAGYPLVTVSRTGATEIRLEERRFRSEGVETPDQTWEVPIVLRYFDGTEVRTHSVLLGGEGTTVSLPAAGPIEWIYPNGGACGYYRWSLERADLTALGAAAATSLEPRERIEFLGNVAALLDSGHLGADVYLETLATFAADESPSVLNSAVAGLGRVHPLLSDDTSRDAFRVYVRSLLAPALDRFGWDPDPHEADEITSFRPQLLGTLGNWGEDPVIAREARLRTERHLEDPSSVDPSLVGTWLTVAAREGDASLWETFEGRFRSATVPRERGRYLSLLGAFRDPALRERALAYSLSESLQPQEVMTIPRVQAGLGEAEADRVLDWILDHHARIVNRIPPPSRAFLPWRGAGCSQARWDRTLAFFSHEENQEPGTPAQLDRAGDSVRDCVRLKERESAAVRSYLVKFAEAARSGKGSERF